LETALVMPVLLLLAFGVVGAGRVVQAQLGISAAAREAARVAALAPDPAEAAARGMAQGQAVAAGYGLANGSLRLSVEPGAFTRGGQVRAAARYEVTLADLPLLGWTRVAVSSEHLERLDLYRSRWPRGEGP
jgi:Flp pilus assembly protein TadG